MRKRLTYNYPFITSNSTTSSCYLSGGWNGSSFVYKFQIIVLSGLCTISTKSQENHEMIERILHLENGMAQTNWSECGMMMIRGSSSKTEVGPLKPYMK